MLSENIYVGQYIDNYRLIATMSSSPTSSIYQAEHNHLERSRVVIKILPGVHLSESRRNSFFKEVELLKKLKHPSILSLQDAGIFEGMPYMVTEYAPRGSLQDRITLQSTAMLPVQEALAILLQVGLALRYAHQFNFIHGNLKPENILFMEENSALLADFNVVTTIDAFSAYHQTNMLPYMAPERFHGWVTKESDQYALGCIAYELLTGQLPFSGSNLSEFKRKHTTEKPIAPTQRNLLLPIPLEDAILKAMEKKSEDRYPSIKDFVTSLALYASSHAYTDTSGHPLVHTFMTGKYPRNKSAPPSSNSFVLPAIHTGVTKNARPETGRINSIPSGVIASLPFSPAAQQYQPTKKPVLPGSPVQENRESTAATLTSITGRVPALLPLGSTMSVPDRHSGASVSRQIWLILLSLLVVLIVITLGSLHFALTSSPSLTSRPAGIPQKSLSPPPPTLTLAPTSRPAPTPTSAPASKLASMPTLTPFPTPSPTPLLTPTPTPISTLAAIPTSMQGETGCQKSGMYYLCTVTLLLSQNAPAKVKWYASANNLAVNFDPSKGTISAGQQQTVTAEVLRNCPQTGSLNFFFQGGETSVQWTC